MGTKQLPIFSAHFFLNGYKTVHIFSVFILLSSLPCACGPTQENVRWRDEKKKFCLYPGWCTGPCHYPIHVNILSMYKHVHVYTLIVYLRG